MIKVIQQKPVWIFQHNPPI